MYGNQSVCSCVGFTFHLLNLLAIINIKHICRADDNTYGDLEFLAELSDGRFQAYLSFLSTQVYVDLFLI